jgi:hypothetical protein
LPFPLLLLLLLLLLLPLATPEFVRALGRT